MTFTIEQLANDNAIANLYLAERKMEAYTLIKQGLYSLPYITVMKLFNKIAIGHGTSNMETMICASEVCAVAVILKKFW